MIIVILLLKLNHFGIQTCFYVLRSLCFGSSLWHRCFIVDTQSPCNTIARCARVTAARLTWLVRGCCEKDIGCTQVKSGPCPLPSLTNDCVFRWQKCRVCCFVTRQAGSGDAGGCLCFWQQLSYTNRESHRWLLGALTLEENSLHTFKHTHSQIGKCTRLHTYKHGPTVQL